MLAGSSWGFDLQKMQNNLLEKQDFSQEKEAILQEVIESLSKTQKELPCKFFYNNHGSGLFDQISELEEYYLTRTEISILNDNIAKIAEIIGEKAVLIELGSGSSKKIRIILDNIKSPEAYVPIEISEEYLFDSVNKVASDYLNLKIFPVVADYTRPFELPQIGFKSKNKVVYYPGSTIGNFNPDRAVDFLNRISKLCGTGSSLLIGIDLKKDIQTIEKAYNDNKGVTAEFNLNILHTLNSILESDFDLNKWQHLAFYNETEGRIEMHLISLENQQVSVNGTKFNFKKDETIHTENSYKYSVEEFESMVNEFYSLKKVWKDDENKFGVCYFISK